jgi:hypothetical protein
MHRCRLGDDDDLDGGAAKADPDRRADARRGGHDAGVVLQPPPVGRAGATPRGGEGHPVVGVEGARSRRGAKTSEADGDQHGRGQGAAAEQGAT